MTQKETLTYMMDMLKTSPDYVNGVTQASEAYDTLSKMLAQVSKPHNNSPEAVERQNAKRKEQTANARATLVATISPILRKVMTTDMTVKDIFAAAQPELPADFTPAKVQNILTREMASEIIKTERKGGKPNLYRLDATKTA